jgi:anti-sigma factor RsiW
MPNNSESQCYFVQLQIDSFIDGELSSAQQEVFMSHVHECAECGCELQYAQTVHDAVLVLPAIDCDENVMEPINRLVNRGDTSSPSSSFWTPLLDWIATAPVFVRYAVPVTAVAVLALALWPVLFNPQQVQQSSPLVATQEINPAESEYSPQEIQAALLELNLAIDYLNDVSQRTEVMIGDRFLVTPLQDSLNASFERASDRRQNVLQNDPI